MDCEYLDRKMKYDGTMWEETEQELRDFLL